MALYESAGYSEENKDRLAAIATLAYEVTLMQTGFRCRLNAVITQGMADRK